MNGTYSSSYSSITLMQSSATITSSGTVNDTSANGIAVRGGNTAGAYTLLNAGLIEAASSAGIGIELGAGSTISNSGTIEATGTASFGIDLRQGGLITNNSGGLIEATGFLSVGVYIRGGTLTNAGTVESGTLGNISVLAYSSFVRNEAGGTIISGHSAAVAISGNGTLANYGMIGSSSESAEAVALGGTLNNSGTIEESWGAGVAGEGATPGGSVNDAFGTITNGGPANTSALIQGGIWGVYFNGAITNYGTVEATLAGKPPSRFYAGIVLDFSKALPNTVTNGTPDDTSALIQGETGIRGHVSATVLNFGTVSAYAIHDSNTYSLIAVQLPQGGAVTNGSQTDEQALIEGDIGVYLASAPKSSNPLTNFGTIANRPGRGTYGVELVGHGGVITNGSTADATAVISGRTAGVDMKSASATLLNYGTVAATGPGASAVLLAGKLVNEAGGMIEGISGVKVLAGYYAAVVNAGTISGSGTSGFGVRLAAYTSATNMSGGLIEATGSGGIAVGESGSGASVFNAGTIEAASTSGLGVAINGAKYVLNSGKIISNSGGPAIEGTAASVTNQAGGTISGYWAVARLLSGSTLENDGLILTTGSNKYSTTVDFSGEAVNEGTILAPYGTAISGYNFTHASYGTLTNGSTANSTALIDGVRGGVAFGGSVINFGTIIGGGGTPHYGHGPISAGIGLGSNLSQKPVESVTNGGPNSTTALIQGPIGVGAGSSFGSNPSATIANFGTILGYVTYQFVPPMDKARYGLAGVALWGGGTITNGSESDRSALIDGRYGVSSSGAPTTITNYGTIEAYSYHSQGRDAIALGAGGQITNGSAQDTEATISGFTSGINLTAGISLTGMPGTITNFGTIAATRLNAFAIDVSSGSKLINEASGVIAEGVSATSTVNNVTIVNSGTIEGQGRYAISLFRGTGDLLQLMPGAVISGEVNMSGTLELSATDASIGTLSGLGTKYGFFSQIKEDVGTRWVLSGGNTIASGETLTVRGRLTNRGTVLLSAGSRIAGSGWILNAGVLEAAGPGTTPISAHVKSSWGTISADAGTMDFTRGGIFGGRFVGAGTIAFGGGQTTLESGLSLHVAALALTAGTVSLGGTLGFAGAFTESGGVLQLAGEPLRLNGAVSLAGGTVSGSGTLVTRGEVELAGLSIAQGAIWGSLGTVTATGIMTLGAADGSSGRFVNRTGATLELADRSGLATAAGSSGSTFFNAGLVEKTGSGPSVVGLWVANNGTIEVKSGTLELGSNVIGTGTLAVAGGVLELDGAVVNTQTLDFFGGGTVALAKARHFEGLMSGFGAGDTLDIAGLGQGSTASWVQTGSTGTLTLARGSWHASLTLYGQYANAFEVTPNGHGGGAVTYAPSAQSQSSIAVPAG